jgi:hypothetical protein
MPASPTSTKSGASPWLSPEADKKFEAATLRVTACQKSWNLPIALGSAAEAYAYKPASPTGPLYAGDVFYNIRQPLLALDFYLLAREAFRKPGAGDYRTRVESRVADAQELTGDVESAIATYAAITGRWPENPEMLIPWLRADMKVNYYKRIQERGIYVRLKHVERADLMLKQFWNLLQADPRYDAAITSGNLDAYHTVVREKGIAVRDIMMRDAETVIP